MIKISIETLFLRYPTSMISDALDELDINGALTGLFPQRYDQGRISGRALPVKFNKKFSDPKAWRFGGGVGKPLEQPVHRAFGGLFSRRNERVRLVRLADLRGDRIVEGRLLRSTM